MTDWDTNDFMSQWDQKYVSTNVRSGSNSYDKEFFFELKKELISTQPELPDISYAIIVRSIHPKTPSTYTESLRHFVPSVVPMLLDDSLTT